jgi:hypothetical protein
MKVRTNIAMYGHPSCVVFDLPDAEAKALIGQGNATAAGKDDGDAIKPIESASFEPAESATLPKATARKAAK